MEKRVVDRKVVAMVDTRQVIRIAVLEERRSISASKSALIHYQDPHHLKESNLRIHHKKIQAHERRETEHPKLDPLPIEESRKKPRLFSTLIAIPGPSIRPVEPPKDTDGVNERINLEMHTQSQQQARSPRIPSQRDPE